MSSSSNTMEPSVMYKYLSADRAVEVLPENGNGALLVAPRYTLQKIKKFARCSWYSTGSYLSTH